MFAPHAQLRSMLRRVIAGRAEQGYDVERFDAELEVVPDSYDAIADLARRVEAAPLRDGWPYVEPDDFDEVLAEMDAARETGALPGVSTEDAAARAEAAFLGSVCGCMLGKPFEIDPTMDDIRAALEPEGEWPLRDYVTEAAMRRLPRTHPQWFETVRERITHAAHDDDVNYTVLGMLVLERHGTGFSKEQLRDMWLRQLPLGTTFGPERTMLARAGVDALTYRPSQDVSGWSATWNPGDELCGALIRADAYGYACPGRPELAATLAWRDASFTHRKTGVYGTMWIAAAIATAFVERDRIGVFRTALRYVPQRSRFAEVVRDAINVVSVAPSYEDAYRTLKASYGKFTHCRIYFEAGTLINTLRFAESVGHGICLQVMQGNDTDSFGATSGSILGAYFGPGHLEDRWLAPFNDDLHTTLAAFGERSIRAVAKRMGALPEAVDPGRLRSSPA